MPRTYRPKNAVVKRSRLDASGSMTVVMNYLCQVEAATIAKRLSVTEPTIHRLINKLQKRLVEDAYLLHILCGLLVEGKAFLEPFAPALRWVSRLTPDDARNLKHCIYNCPSAVSLSAQQFQGYMMSGRMDFLDDTEWCDGRHLKFAEYSRLADYHFRPDYCDGCPNPMRRDVDLIIINSMSFDDILHPVYRKNFARHISALMIRRCARERILIANEEKRLYDFENLDGFEHEGDMRAEIIRKWLDSAIPYLRKNPL